jgi:hypothetical protein
VDHSVPCVSRIVDNDMDLAVAELGRLLDKSRQVGVVRDIARNGNGSPGRSVVNRFCRRFCFACARRKASVIYPNYCWWRLLTDIDVPNDNFRPLVGEQSGRLGTNTLACSCDDGNLARKHTLREIELRGNLRETI